MMWFDIIKADPPYVGRKGGGGHGRVRPKWAEEVSEKKHIDIVKNLLLKLKQEIPQLNWESSGFVKGDDESMSRIHQPFNEISQIFIWHKIGASDSEFLIQIMAPGQDEPPKYLTAEEIITKIKKHIIEPRERAKQWIIETANKLDYVTINGDLVEIEPEWVVTKNNGAGSGFKGPISFKYVFNMNNIHDQLCILHVVTDSDGRVYKNNLCLHRNKTFNVPIADSYVTTMLMAGNKTNWESMWGNA